MTRQNKVSLPWIELARCCVTTTCRWFDLGEGFEAYENWNIRGLFPKQQHALLVRAMVDRPQARMEIVHVVQECQYPAGYAAMEEQGKLIGKFQFDFYDCPKTSRTMVHSVRPGNAGAWILAYGQGIWRIMILKPEN